MNNHIHAMNYYKNSIDDDILSRVYSIAKEKPHVHYMGF